MQLPKRLPNDIVEKRERKNNRNNKKKKEINTGTLDQKDASRDRRLWGGEFSRFRFRAYGISNRLTKQTRSPSQFLETQRATRSRECNVFVDRLSRAQTPIFAFSSFYFFYSQSNSRTRSSRESKSSRSFH